MRRALLNALRDPHLWLILALMAGCTGLHYSGSRLIPAIGLQRHTVVRITFLAPVAYAAYRFGLAGGLSALAAAVLMMLPRVFLMSTSPPDALFEIVMTALVGGFFNAWLESRRRDIGRREQQILGLEAARHELQSNLERTRESERRLAAINSVCSVVNQAFTFEEVLDVALGKLGDVAAVDAAVVHLISPDGRLILAGSHGLSDEAAAAVSDLDLDRGPIGEVARTGRIRSIADIHRGTDQPPGLRSLAELRSLYIVPLRSKDRIKGALGVGTGAGRMLDREERKLVSFVGFELGIAAEKADFIAEIQRMTVSLRLYADQAGRAHEAERTRIARELHDDTVQTLVAVSRRLDTFLEGASVSSGASDSSGIPQADDGGLEPLHAIQRDVDDALVRMRRFIQDLRPPTLEYLGLWPALRELAGQVSARSGMEVAVSGGRPARLLGSEEQLLVYRIVQEAVRNAERHARARRIGIELRESRDRLEVRVADDGCGFRTGESGAELLSRGKLGLMGMRERAHLLGGGIRIDSEPGRGTEVVLTLDG